MLNTPTGALSLPSYLVGSDNTSSSESTSTNTPRTDSFSSDPGFLSGTTPYLKSTHLLKVGESLGEFMGEDLEKKHGHRWPITLDASECDFQHQSVEVPGTKGPGHSAIYRNQFFPEGPLTVESSYHYPKTLFESFNKGLSVSADKPCLGHRPINLLTGEFENTFEWLTYSEVDKKRQILGSAFTKLASDGSLGELPDTKHWRMGLWSPNRPEWQLSALAASAFSCSFVSLYDNLGQSNVSYLINHSSIRMVLCAATHVSTLLSLASECPTMKVIVVMDSWAALSLSGEGGSGRRQSMRAKGSERETVFRKWGKREGVKVMDWDEVMELGEKNLTDYVPPKPDDEISVCYTSGTTGKPKGAVLTHRAVTAATISTGHIFVVKPTDMLLSFLPLSHIYQRMVEEVMFMTGGPIGFSCGDVMRLNEDLQLLKPTIFVAVPRVLNRMYQKMHSAICEAPGIKGTLLKWAYDTKVTRMRQFGTTYHPVLDPLIFNKVKAQFGGNITHIVTASAPIAPEVLQFLKVALGTKVLQAYGQTENCGIVTISLADDPEIGKTTGGVQPAVEVRLVDCPEMGYTADDKPNPRGEICMRGEPCTKEYLYDPEKTKELIDSDGWLHSGDVAEFDVATGRIMIIDRIKNLLKLSQGEYVALEKVENAYVTSPLIGQLYIHGESLYHFLVAIIVPTLDHYSKFASKVLGRDLDDQKALNDSTKDPKVLKAYLEELDKEAKRAGLAGFEKIKGLYLTLDPFTMENDLLTPTFKVKRNIAAKYFRPQIDQLYKTTKA